MPGAVPAHRMAGEIGSLWVRLESPLSMIEHLDRIETAPVFPVEPVRATIGGCDDVQTRLARIALRLTDAFDSRSVKRENQSGRRLARAWQCRHDGIVLQTSIDRAAERSRVCLAGLANSQIDLGRIERLPRRTITAACFLLELQLDQQRSHRSMGPCPEARTQPCESTEGREQGRRSGFPDRRRGGL